MSKVKQDNPVVYKCPHCSYVMHEILYKNILVDKYKTMCPKCHAHRLSEFKEGKLYNE